MKKFYLGMWHRWGCLKVIGLMAVCGVMMVPDQARAQGALVDRFLVPYFASYREPGLSLAGATTSAFTVITIANIFSTQCTISIEWFSGNEIVYITTSDTTRAPLLQRNIVNHCSRAANTRSEAPDCASVCTLPEDPTEGLARIKVNEECQNHIGVDASIYYTLFEENSDTETEIILSARSPQVYKLNPASLPPSVE